MWFKRSEDHPIFDYLQTDGPVSYTDTRICGDGWHFDCHAHMVLPLTIIPQTFPFMSRLTIIFPGVEKPDVINYLTYCYSGRIPSSDNELQGVKDILKMMVPSMIFGEEKSTVASDEEEDIHEETSDLNYNSKKTVKVIMPSSSKSVPDNIKCDHCSKIIKFKKNLSRHMAVFHQNLDHEKYGCDLCEVEFSSKYHLDRHLESKNCLKNLTQECKKCKKRFVSVEKLKIHLDKNCQKKHFCDICFKFYKNKREFKMHVDSHKQR